MILVILAILITVAVIGTVIFNRTDNEGVGWIALASGALAFVLVIVLMALLGTVSTGRCIPEKIKMYEEQNQEVEQSVSEVIDTYIASQVNIQKEVVEKINNSESSIAIIAAFPDINASEAIQAQIELYQENNQKIKSLKEELIELSVYRWWIYFGH